MDGQATFEILIKGQRDGKPLSREAFDVDEWIAALKNGRNLLYPEKSNKKRPQISFDPQSGSIRILMVTATAAVVQANALMARVNQTAELGILPSKQAEAVRYFHNLALDNQFDVFLGEAGQVEKGLHLHRRFEFHLEEPAWVEVNTTVWGKVVDMGGKTLINIHLETDLYGSLTLSATEDQLAQETKNRLYQRQQVQVRLFQNAFTGEYHPKSGQFLGFVDHPEESMDEYLTRLVKQATPALSQIKDKDAWLREIRGYNESD
ncbi:MAG: hypothetical protein AAF399_30610 [Bacteroidota bacterium]